MGSVGLAVFAAGALAALGFGDSLTLTFGFGSALVAEAGVSLMDVSTIIARAPRCSPAARARLPSTGMRRRTKRFSGSPIPALTAWSIAWTAASASAFGKTITLEPTDLDPAADPAPFVQIHQPRRMERLDPRPNRLRGLARGRAGLIGLGEIAVQVGQLFADVGHVARAGGQPGRVGTREHGQGPTRDRPAADLLGRGRPGRLVPVNAAHDDHHRPGEVALLNIVRGLPACPLAQYAAGCPDRRGRAGCAQNRGQQECPPAESSPAEEP